MLTVGSRLRELRKAAGYKSAEDFAEALGMHPNSVYAVERGQTWISADLLARATKLLNVRREEFFRDDAEPTAHESTFGRKERLIRAILDASPAELQHFIDLLDDLKTPSRREAKKNKSPAD